MFTALCIGLVSAALFTHRSHSVQEDYIGGDLVRGTVNISFNQIRADSIVRSNFIGNLTLREWLAQHDLTLGSAYNCTTPNCQEGYTKGSTVSSLSLQTLNASVGFAVDGDPIQGVQSMNLTVTGSAAPSCYQQLSATLLGETILSARNMRYVDETCFSPSYGCFEKNASSFQTVTIPSSVDNSLYCEKIRLAPAPAYRIGANISETTSTTSSLFMRMYDTEGILVGQCTLPSLTAPTQEVDCIVPSASGQEKEYFVCVGATSASSYRIRTETRNPCGTNSFGESYPIDYEIYAKNLKFDSPLLNINEATLLNTTGTSLRSSIETYLSSAYGNKCNPSCILPIVFTGAQQQLSFSNVQLVYNPAGAQGAMTNTLYSLQTTTPVITSGMLELDLLKANFTIPTTGTYRYLDFYIGNDRVFREPISVSAGFDFSITPLFAPFGQKTTFSVKNSNATQTIWTFEGGAPETVLGNSTSYTFSTEGQKSVSVNVLLADGRSSTKSFTITVGDARSAANETLRNYERALASFSSNVSTLPPVIAGQVRAVLNVSELSASVSSYRVMFNNATNESEYADIMSALSGLKVPARVSQSASGTVPLIIGLAQIDPMPYVQRVDSELTVEPSHVQSKLIEWNQENFEGSIQFTAYTVYYALGDSERIATLFTVQPQPQQGVSEAPYLVLSVPQSLVSFSQGIQGESSGSGTLVSLGSPTQPVEFSVAGSVEASELGVYLAPRELQALGSFESTEHVPEEGSSARAHFIVIAIIILVIFTLLMALALWWYYRHQYEKALFPNKTDLANILGFIMNARKTGVSEELLVKRLRDAGWTREQISYGLKKSKRLAAQPKTQQNAKFIKRPGEL